MDHTTQEAVIRAGRTVNGPEFQGNGIHGLLAEAGLVATQAKLNEDGSVDVTFRLIHTPGWRSGVDPTPAILEQVHNALFAKL